MTLEAKPEEGLRSRKKAQQRLSLLHAAMELLSEHGYEDTRIEDIAKVANVSLKTVYNYFPSKQSILIEILREDRRKMLDAYEDIARKPPKDLAKALSLMIQADMGDVDTPRRKKLWRELLAAETRSHDQKDDDFEQNREVFMGFLRRLLLHFRQAGVLSHDVNIDLAAPMIYGVMAYNFRQYCAIENMTPEEFLSMTRKQMKLLLTSWMAG